MATRLRYSKWAFVAISGGAALTAIEVYGAVSFLVSQGQPNYLVAGGAVVTCVAAILPVLAGRCWQAGRYAMALMLYAAMAPALSVIVFAAVERTGSASDGAERGRQAVALRRELALAAEKDAKAVAASDEAAAKAECATGRGPRCLGLEARADQSRQRLEAARSDVARAGVVPKDPAAARFAAVLPVSEEAVRLYQPLILPLAISALGLLLVAVGALRPERRKAKKAVRKRKRRPRLGNRVKLPQPLPANVVMHPRHK